MHHRSTRSAVTTLVLTVVASFAVACADRDLTGVAPAGMIRSQLDGQPLSAAKVRYVRRFVGGCALRAENPGYARWAIAATPAELPFAILARGEPSRRARIAVPVRNSRIVVDCVVTRSMTDDELAARVSASYRHPKWLALWNRLKAAPRVSLAAPRVASLEAREVRAEVLGLVGAAAAAPRDTRGNLRIATDIYQAPGVTITAEPYKEPEYKEPAPWEADYMPPEREPSPGDEEYDQFDHGGEQYDNGGGDQGGEYVPPTTTTDSTKACDSQDPNCRRMLDTANKTMLDSAIKLIRPQADSMCQRALDTLNAMLTGGRVTQGASSAPENLDPTDTSKHDGQTITDVSRMHDSVSIARAMHIDEDVFTRVRSGTVSWRGLAQLALHEAMHGLLDTRDPDSSQHNWFKHTGESGPVYTTWPFNLVSSGMTAGQGCVP